MKLHEKMRRHSEDSGRTQVHIARSIGATGTQFNRWLTGENRPDEKYLIRFARELGVPLDYLLDEEMDTPPQSRFDLSPSERTVLDIVRIIGADEAIRRLTEPSREAAVGLIPPKSEGSPQSRKSERA